MTDNVIEFIKARLDEDQHAAEKATDGPWTAYRNRGVFAGVLDRDWVAGTDPADADHIARHDPARVLRGVEAKRLLIKPHEPSFYDDQLGCGECGWPADYPDPAIIPQWWPCQTVRLIASEWADHVDYREEWTPT